MKGVGGWGCRVGKMGCSTRTMIAFVIMMHMMVVMVMRVDLIVATIGNIPRGWKRCFDWSLGVFVVHFLVLNNLFF